MKKIYIVEDNVSIAYDLKETLVSLGYDVPLWANSGEEALDMMAKDLPDLVLMDIKLAGKIDGVETAKQVNQKYKIPIIYITSYSDEALLERAKTTHPSGFLFKPFQERELYANIEIALYTHQLERELEDANKRLTLEIETRKTKEEKIRWQAQLLDCVNESVVATDLQGHVTYWGKGAEKLYGYNAKEVMGQKITFIVDPKDENKKLKRMRHVLETGSWNGEYQQKRKNGEVFWADTGISLVMNENQQTVGFIGIDRDITARKKAEINLRQSRERYRSVVDTTTEGIITIDEHGFIIFANQAIQYILGYTIQEILQQSITMIVPDFLRYLDKELVYRKNFLNKEVLWEPIELSAVHKNGKKLLLLLSVGEFSEGVEHLFTIVIRDITKYKQAELELIESEEKFAKTFFSSPYSMAISTFDAGKYIDVNQAFTNLFGYEKREVIGKTAFELNTYFNFNDRNTIIRMLENGEQVKNLELLRKTKNGEIKTCNLSAEIINLTGKKCLLGISIDITERKKAEEALQKEKIKAQTYLDIVGVMLVALDTNQKVTLINKKGCEILGYSEKKIIGKNWFDHFLPLEIREQMKPVFAKLLIGEIDPVEYYENPVLTKNGTQRMIAWHNTILTDKQGTIIGILGSGEDITARVMAEQEIQYMQNYLNNVFDSMPSILISVDPQGHITHWNIEAERKTGLTIDQVKGKAIEEVIPEFKEQLHQLQLALNKYLPQKQEKIYSETDGQPRYSDLMVYPLLANGPEGAVIRIDDVTSRVRIEEMMIQTEKMMSVGGLAAGMAHEINNPLGGILQSIQNIQRRLSKNMAKNVQIARELGISLEQIISYLEQRSIMDFLDGIRNAGIRASKIVANMLQFSRQSQSQKQGSDIHALINSTIELAENDYDLKRKYDFRHIQIVRDFDPNIPYILLAQTEIEQVLLNLLKNAAQAMKISSSNVKPQIHIRSKLMQDHFIIELEDNGRGMDENTRRRVFEPFFTTKKIGVGTGLGLSVSYMIISNNHRGSIEVESVPDKGTKFIIKLPLEDMDDR